jgi:hypothetical protein
MQEIVYQTRPTTIQDVKIRISQAFQMINLKKRASSTQEAFKKCEILNI